VKATLANGDISGTQMLFHGGEVSGFLASNSVFRTRGGAIVTLSNVHGISFLGALTKQIAGLVFLPDVTETALRDCKTSLSRLGKLKSVTRAGRS